MKIIINQVMQCYMGFQDTNLKYTLTKDLVFLLPLKDIFFEICMIATPDDGVFIIDHPGDAKIELLGLQEFIMFVGNVHVKPKGDHRRLFEIEEPRLVYRTV
jgi:hypothetical protein